MCETQSIRYVHYMEHFDFGAVLGVGCICAGHMEQNYEKAKRRENKFKSIAQRRVNWMNATWKESRKDNPYLNRKGLNVVLYETSNRFGYRIKGDVSHKTWRGTGYTSLEEAKLAAFECFWAIEDS